MKCRRAAGYRTSALRYLCGGQTPEDVAAGAARRSSYIAAAPVLRRSRIVPEEGTP
jgi:hypothetical protein